MTWLAAGLGAGALGVALLSPPARAVSGFASPALAQEEEPSGNGQQESGEAADKEADSDEEDTWLAIRGGDIHTGTGAVLRGATLLAKNQKIAEIGYDLWIPDEATVIDATGMRLYPGLVAVNSVGLFGTNGDFEDSIDPFNSQMTLALAGGITTAAQSMIPVKLRRFEIEDVVAGPRVLAAQQFSNSNPSSKSSLREKLQRAAEYLRAVREAGGKEDEKKGPSKKGVDTTALAILKGEQSAYFSTSARGELLEIARLAQEFGFRPVIEGAAEGWTVADELGRAGAYVIVTPRFRSDKDERLVREGGSSIENAAILHASGVQVAILPGSPNINLSGIVGRDLLHLPVEASFAVRGGMSEDAALAGITIVPARILGIGHRAGSLEIGKDADVLVTDGDILHYETFVQYAVVSGKLAYDKEEELFFAHIRPRTAQPTSIAEEPPTSELAPEERLDAGEEPVPDDEEDSEGDGDDDGDDESETGDGR